MHQCWLEEKLSFTSQSEFAHDFDYYGFSDQDDIWLPDKLSTCIKMMEADSGPDLSQHTALQLTVDENLQMRGEQEHRTAQPLNHKKRFRYGIFPGLYDGVESGVYEPDLETSDEES